MSAIARVIRREFTRLRRLPVLVSLLVPVPIVMGVLLLGVFNVGVARQMPVGILDLDGTPTSRTATRWVDAVRTVNVVTRLQDLGQAQDQLLRRKVYAVVMVPRHFQRDLLHGRSPKVTLLYNEQYFTVASLVFADVAGTIGTAAIGASAGLREGVGLTESAALALAAPVRLDTRVLFNPALSYAIGVGLMLIVGVLQNVSAISTVYLVGRELQDGTPGQWLDAAGGSPFVAWIGKLSPYVLWDLVLALLLVGGWLVWFHVPVRGHFAFLALGALAFSLATKAFAVMLTVWLGGVSEGAGLGSFIFSPAVTFSGFTFPLLAMPGFDQFWGGLIPLTHFMLFLRDQVLVDASFPVSMQPINALLLTLGIAGGLALPRLSRVLREPKFWGGE